MNETSHLIFIITHFKRINVTDAFCSAFPLPPSLGIPACASEGDMLGLAFASSNPQTSACASLGITDLLSANDWFSKQRQPSFQRLRKKSIINQCMWILFIKI